MSSTVAEFKGTCQSIYQETRLRLQSPSNTFLDFKIKICVKFELHASLFGGFIFSVHLRAVRPVPGAWVVAKASVKVSSGSHGEGRAGASTPKTTEAQTRFQPFRSASKHRDSTFQSVRSEWCTCSIAFTSYWYYNNEPLVLSRYVTHTHEADHVFTTSLSNCGCQRRTTNSLWGRG